ncbi:MAG: DUF4179 domain-containing protein [Candidatus Omnitrophica bacterium]|nr:DUF4179 domain-containing protein [Candidatus Omnitrophota bacterium]
MSEERLEQELRDYFKTEVEKVEPSRQWWDDAISSLGEQKRHSRWSGLMPKTRLAWALVSVLILLLIGGTVYGASSLVRELFQRLATDVEKAGLAQELDLGQTIGGVTVKLERAYADSNVVLVGFTVSGPKERYHANIGKLSTADGQEISGMLGMGVVPGSSFVLGSWPESQRAAIITAFDASSIKGASSQLGLRLETSVADSPIPGENQASIGPFIFDFKVPFHAGKVISINQTVEAAGVPVTLERVIISPWATQAVFSFYPPYDNILDRPLLVASVQPAGGDSVNSGLGKTQEAASAEFFIGDLTAKSGEWTITVKELVFPPKPTGQKTEVHPASDTKRLAGPWFFQFQVP